MYGLIIGEPVNPMIFVTALRSAFPQFAQQERGHEGMIYSQQDAEECFTTLVSCFDKTLPSVDGSKENGFIKQFLNIQFETK